MLMLADPVLPTTVEGARLGRRAVLLAMPAETAAQRLAARALPPPCGTVSVRGEAGEHAIVAVAEPETQAKEFCLIESAPDRLAADPIAMAETLDAASQARLLDFLLGFCRTAFRLSDDAAFAATCLRLARRCARDGGEAQAVARLTPGLVMLAGVAAQPGDALYLIGPRGVRHSRMAAAQTANLQPLEVAREGEVLLAMGGAPTLWRLRPVRSALPNLPALSPAQAAACRAAAVAALHRAAPHSREAALRREWQLAAPAAPRSLADAGQPVGGALDLALDTGAGLFLRGWLRDPAGLVAAMEVVGPGGAVALAPSALHRFERRDVRERFAASPHRSDDGLAGFVAHLADPRLAGATQPALRLHLHSGAVAELVPSLQMLPPEGGRNSVLAAVPPEQVTDAMLQDCIAPAAAALHRAAQLQPCDVAVRQFGKRVEKPAVSIAVPLYRELGFLRFQLAALAGDPDCADAELLFVLDSPEQRAEAEHLLAGLHRLHGLALTLLLPQRNLGFSRACNLAAEHARAPALLLLNSDVVPAGPGWLAPLLAGLRRHVAVGPKLLFDDDSIQHAGLFFERDADGVWFNQHFHKGMPRRWPAASRARAVPGVTGAALLVRRSAFEAAGGVCTDYIIGDYEDSDLCLRLRANGGSIGYVPRAELYHFERRSIALHPGYTRTLACRYNRMLHHARWDAAIAALMAA